MIKNYTIVKEEHMNALDGQGILLEHDKTGARIFVVKNQDENKVFNIIFRTPPADDTGLPHILEHSVLCGSRKFPVKDPFVELAKGSLNTFLNAMTYSDKTMYPVASCNDKDFANLVDVYLDAVLYPNIYNDPRILQQEGWHYELDQVDGELIYNGVVYNEMKGASSSPEQVLFRQIQAVLFPDHPYGCDSGGEPTAIPDLTSEQFLDFHKRYYHPSNSFIYFYGDLDVEEKLQWLDEAYLSAFDKIDIDSSLTEVPAFEAPVYAEKAYAISAEESIDKKTYLSYNLAMNKPEDHWDTVGLEILEYLLLEAPGAPLKEALLKLNIAEDVFGSFDGGINQPTFSVIAKNANPEDEAIFVETIEKVLNQIATQGIDQRKIMAGINKFEFKLREADFGQYPKGIIYSINALDTWLYDMDPFVNFAYDEAFSKLKDGVEKGYFSELLKKYLIGNSHCGILKLVPDPNMLADKEAVLKEKLDAKLQAMTKEDQQALVDETEALKVFQAEPNTKEELETIPLLELSDIDEEGVKVEYATEEFESSTFVLHETFTNNIVYGKLLFDFSHLKFEDIPKVSLLAKLFIKVSTEQFDYASLTDEINLLTGGISTNATSYAVSNNPNVSQPKLEVKFKCFSDKVDETIKLIKEIVTNSVFDDTKRLMDIVNENKSRLSMNLMSAGHSASMNRALSYHFLNGKYKDLLDGIGFFRYLESIKTEEDVQKVIADMSLLKDQIINQNDVVVLLNTEGQFLDMSKDKFEAFIASLPAIDKEDIEEELLFESLNEGFKSSSKVQYCAQTGDFVKEGYTYTGYMKVLQTIMSLDYMWTEVRIKGGAYGGFGGFRRSGVFYLGSYRDPNLIKTYEIYKGLVTFINEIDLDDREIVKYIIGTISQLDTPMTPSMKGERALNMFMSEITEEDFAKERAEILSVKVQDLKDIAPLIEKVLGQNHICVIGNESIIDSEKEILENIEPLFN